MPFVKEEEFGKQFKQDEEKLPYTIYNGQDFYKTVFSKACEGCKTVIKTDAGYVFFWEESKENYGTVFVCRNCKITVEPEILKKLKSGRTSKVQWEFLKYCQTESKEVINKEKSGELRLLMEKIQEKIVSSSEEVIVEIKQYNENLLQIILELAEKDKDFYNKIRDKIVSNNKNLLDYLQKMTNSFDDIIQKSTLILKIIKT